MDIVKGKLSVFFENPFWIGIFECISDQKLSVCKVTFGSEPKDCEIYEFILKNYYRLPFSPAVEAEEKDVKCNPKRIQREIRKQIQNIGKSTKSQQALQLQRQQIKIENKKISRLKKKADKQYQFNLKQQKRKDKHKGK